MLPDLPLLAFHSLLSPSYPLFQSGDFGRELLSELFQLQIALLARLLAETNSKIPFSFLGSGNLLERWAAEDLKWSFRIDPLRKLLPPEGIARFFKSRRWRWNKMSLTGFWCRL